MVAAYLHDIAAWQDGTEGLDDHEYRAYHVICGMIYQNNGPIVYHESGIAGRCGQHPLRFRKAVDKLMEKGKLRRLPGGKITNVRAEKELEKSARRRKGLSANPPATPAAPPAHPPRTPAAPPPGKPRKPLKNKNAVPEQGVLLDTIRYKKEDSDSPRGENPDSINNPVETQIPSPKAARRCATSDWPPDYRERFWAKYPRRTEKQAAMKKLDVVRSTGLPWATFWAGVERYATWCVGTEQAYIKHPATWLNRGCWDDELGKPRAHQERGRNSNNGAADLLADWMTGRRDDDEHASHNGRESDVPADRSGDVVDLPHGTGYRRH